MIHVVHQSKFNPCYVPCRQIAHENPRNDPCYTSVQVSPCNDAGCKNHSANIPEMRTQNGWQKDGIAKEMEDE